jgi:hypothetical protein
VRHAKEALEAGFTTVRDVGNSGDYLDMDLEKAIRFGITPGPTIVPAGRIIAPFSGQFWDTPADPKRLYDPEFYFADSQDEMRKAVRENLYWGAKVIKIVVDSKRYQYSADDIRFIVGHHEQSAQPSRGARWNTSTTSSRRVCGMTFARDDQPAPRSPMSTGARLRLARGRPHAYLACPRHPGAEACVRHEERCRAPCGLDSAALRSRNDDCCSMRADE